MSNQTTALPAERLVEWIVGVLTARSMFKFDAKGLAESIVSAELAGLRADGLGLLERLLGQIDKGDIDPRGRPVQLNEAAAMLFLDGSSAVGTVGVSAACKWLAARVPEVGAAVVVVKGSREAGHPAIAISALATAGLVGICASSSLRGLSASEATTRVGAAFPTDGGSIERFETDDDSTFAVVLSALAGGQVPHTKELLPNRSVAEHVVVAIDPAHTAGLAQLSQRLSEFPSAGRVALIETAGTFLSEEIVTEVARIAASYQLEKL